MATMDREAFAEYLDSSWLDFRQRLLAVYPEASVASVSGVASGGSSGFYDSEFYSRGILENSSSDYDPSDPNTSTGSLAPAQEKEFSVRSRMYSDEDEENERGGHDPESNELLAGALADRSKEQVEAARNRLRLRLGATSSNKLVSGKRLLEAVQSLGLTKYTEEDMNGFVNQLADWINLTFEGEDKTKNSKSGRKSKRRNTFENSLNLGLFSFQGMPTTETKKLGKPKWSYPQDQSIDRGRSSFGSKPITPHMYEVREERCHYNVVPAQPLVDVFLATEEEAMKKVFGAAHFKQYQAMREILLAGDTNRLVAELTFVRINDLAAPPEPVHPLTYIEPVVALLIVGNGVMIGFQSDPGYENWHGWPFLELGFACLLILEVLLRMHWLKCARYWCGPDRIWNWFDLFLVAVGISDFCLQLFGTDASIQHASLLRFCRLIRLVRIVKVFRIRIMRDLRLMVKGLIAGIRTLFLAFILLFAVLYVMSGFATLTIGNSETAEKLGLTEYFYNIPRSMFTAFRCFTGECVNEAGQPIHYMLAAEFGSPFVLAYVASYMLVTMGIFNVILAVYVDITMKAAKETDAVTAEQYSRESIRIARTTRELLKKFSLAHRVYHLNEGEEEEEDKAEAEESTRTKLAKMKTTTMFEEDGMHEKIAISKELFLLVVQDQTVQALMDELDLPPDRANLFEIIDADGSGTLQITELLHGLLKIRGEINKSDAVASLLATRAVQHQVAELQERNQVELALIRRELQEQRDERFRLLPLPKMKKEQSGSRPRRSASAKSASAVPSAPSSPTLSVPKPLQAAAVEQTEAITIHAPLPYMRILKPPVKPELSESALIRSTS